MTSNPETDARATMSRQLLVPRSMAAKVCAKRPRCQPPLSVESPAIANSSLYVGRDGNRGKRPRRARLPRPAGIAKSSARPDLGDSLTVEQPALTRLV